MPSAIPMETLACLQVLKISALMILFVRSVSTVFESEVRNCKDISPIALASFKSETSLEDKIS